MDSGYSEQETVFRDVANSINNYKLIYIKQSIYQLKHRIQLLLDTQTYDMVYVSFGGKYNESHLSFNYPEKISNLKYVTNASYQMIPQFLRDRDVEYKILSVTIDHFDNTDILQKNKQIIYNVISRDENQIDAIIFDHLCAYEDIANIVDFMTSQMVARDMNEKRYMICNYIKYHHPNLLEHEFEENVPKTIQRVLNNPTFHRYSTCFYNWFGNSVYTYNIIYNYKKYVLYSYYGNVFPILDRNLNGLHLSCMNMASIYSAVNNTGISPNQKGHFDDFLQNGIDITTYCASFESIAEPLTKYYAY
jgi:hypothetical protein